MLFLIEFANLRQFVIISVNLFIDEVDHFFAFLNFFPKTHIINCFYPF